MSVGVIRLHCKGRGKEEGTEPGEGRGGGGRRGVGCAANFTLAQGVYELKVHSKITPKIAKALKSVKIALYPKASKDEMRALNASENIDQAQRKQHIELDNIWALTEWTESMKSFPCLDSSKTLDIFKFGLALTDPRAPATLIS